MPANYDQRFNGGKSRITADMPHKRECQQRPPVPNHRRATIIGAASSDELYRIDTMAARLVVAARTMRALPNDALSKPSGTRSSWPEFVQKTRFLYGHTRASSLPRPHPRAIDDLAHLMALFWQLRPDERRLVWARACGIPWAVLMARFGRSRTSLNRDHKVALAVLCRHDRQQQKSKT